MVKKKSTESKVELPKSGPESWRTKPQTYLYAAAVLCLLGGQAGILAQQWSAGIFLTSSALVLILAAQIPFRKWLELYRTLLQLGAKLESLARQRTHPAAPKTPPVSSTHPKKEGATQPALMLAPAKLAAKVEAKPDVLIEIPRRWLAISGIALVLFSQPFLFFEKIVLAMFLVVPGIFLTISGFSTRSRTVVLGTLAELQKGLSLSLPGILCMAVGNFLLVRHVHTSLWKESLGIALNITGILTLLKLFPRWLPDPEAENSKSVLNEPTGAAVTPKGLLGKASLALLGLVCLLVGTGIYGDGHYTAGLALCLAGIGSLALSFPWSYTPAIARPAENIILTWLGKYFRLGLFLLALYLGYTGQLEFAREQAGSALWYFGFAALALWLAFREPGDPATDAWQEKPLAWYWETLGLLVILGVAFWWRSRLIGSIPFGIECDEAGGTNNALDIARNLNSLTAHPIGAPLFLLLPRVVSTALFGIGNLGVKADSIFFGVVGIFAIYLLSRQVWGPRVGLAVASLLTLSRWHLHFSRFGFNNAFFIVLLMIGLYFLMKGLSSRRKWHFAFSGVGFALALQTETAGRLVPILCFGLLVYLFLSQRRFWQRNWRPLLVMLLGAWLAGGSIVIYFAKNTNILLRRVQEVSIYSADVNAPANPVKGFLDSARISLTQLNWHGDYRTRHNGGLSGEALLDFWTAILFGLGLLYSLYHWRRRRYGIILIWFFGFMCASVFSIEAPQSHRAFGMLPAVFLLIGAFLDRARRLLQEVLGKPGVLAGAAVFGVLLVPIYQTNFHKYFDTVPAFDTNCTEVARYIGKFNPDKWETMLMTAYFWRGHPPFMLYAPNMSGRFYTTPSDALPYRLDNTKNVMYPLVLEYPQILDSVKWFYPGGHLVEETHPKYGLMFESWEVPAEEVAKTRGLIGRYWSNSNWSGKPALERIDKDISLTWDDKHWPLANNGSMEWEGTIWIPHLSHYTFYLYSTDWVEATIGKSTVLQAADKQEMQKILELPEGLNRIRVRARRQGPASRMLLAWSCAESVEYYIHECPQRESFAKQPFPGIYYFTYRQPQGLLETYYHTPDWTEAPLRKRVQPVIYNWSGFGNEFRSATWQGFLQADRPGEYRFQMDANEYADISVDGALVFQRGSLPKGVVAAANPKPSIQLAAGRHRLNARWSAGGGGYKLWWTKPDGTHEIIPTWSLTPDEN